MTRGLLYRTAYGGANGIGWSALVLTVHAIRQRESRVAIRSGGVRTNGSLAKLFGLRDAVGDFRGTIPFSDFGFL
jgi:hypothetical protein